MGDDWFSRFPRRRSVRQQLTRRHGPSSNQRFQPLPAPTGAYPFRLELADILPAQQIAEIEAAGRVRFHSCGDTGGIKDPAPQERVAARLVDDLQAGDPPRFLYHLGDVVYFFGETREYFPQFYEPYEGYTAPIFAIAGNHDGDVEPDSDATSLAAFVRNLCAPTPVRTPEAHDSRRAAMTQPNVYWTLRAPFVTIIGLYTNVPDGGRLADDQLRWLAHELADAPAGLALIVALHHPVYSADLQHGSNLTLGDLLDGAFERAGRAPDAVLCGHVHNYQRYERRYGGRTMPYVVAGAGGYHNLHPVPVDRLPLAHPEHEDVRLVSYLDSDFGYLHVEASPAGLAFEYRAAATGTTFDRFDVRVDGG